MVISQDCIAFTNSMYGIAFAYSIMCTSRIGRMSGYRGTQVHLMLM